MFWRRCWSLSVAFANAAQSLSILPPIGAHTPPVALILFIVHLVLLISHATPWPVHTKDKIDNLGKPLFKYSHIFLCHILSDNRQKLHNLYDALLRRAVQVGDELACPAPSAPPALKAVPVDHTVAMASRNRGQELDGLTVALYEVLLPLRVIFAS